MSKCYSRFYPVRETNDLVLLWILSSEYRYNLKKFNLLVSWTSKHGTPATFRDGMSLQ